MAALTSVKARPIPAIARPAAVKMATPLVNEITKASFSLTKPVTAVATWPMKSTSFCRPGARASPIAKAVPSIAESVIRIEPPRPASISLAVLAAVPSAVRSTAARSATPPADLESTLAEVMPNSPKASAIRFVRSATGILAVTSLISSRIVMSGLRLPAASWLEMPKSSCSFSPLAAEITPRRRRAVPASLPWMPTLPSTPRMAAVSSSDRPSSFATGPAYFSDSPRPSTVLNVLLAVAVSTSAALVASVAPSPNCRSVAAMMPAERAASVPVARERSSTAPVMFSISFGEKPARPSSVMRFATCTAVNEVVAPRLRATSVSRCSSDALACETAAVARMASSNWAKLRIARPSGRARAVPTVAIRVPRLVSDAPICPIRFCSPFKAAKNFLGSAPISMKTCPPLTAVELIRVSASQGRGVFGSLPESPL